MKQQISPKTAAIIIGVLVVVVLAIGYKVFFTQSTVERPNIPKGQEYKLRPTGGEAYHNPQSLGPQQGGAPGR